MSSGIRISQAGIPVEKAADYQKTMDERWPVLEHSFMGTIELNNFSTASEGVLNNAAGTVAHIPIFKHGLRYLPAFRVKVISYSGFDPGNTPLINNMFADEEKVYLTVSKSAGSILINLKFWIAVVDRDCTQAFQAPIDQTTSLFTSQPSKYGLKILDNPTLQGIGEKSKRAFTFNTNAKSMTIQQHGIGSATVTTPLAITHRLGYPPTYYLAQRSTQTGSTNPSAGKVTMSPLGINFGLASSDSNTLTIRGAQTVLVGDFMFIILKDPVDVAR